MRRNRLLYLLMLALTAGAAYVYGERLLYVALAVLLIMPVASLLLTFVLLYVLRVTQTLPDTIVKSERAFIKLHLHNVSPAFFGNIACNFHTDDFAVEMEEALTIWLRTKHEMQQFDDRYRGVKLEIPFSVKYRGLFAVGLKSIRATDLMGLFRLTRRVNRKQEILALPRVIALNELPLAAHLLTQAQSRFDIKDEDYATISDIRPYVPTDSVKRVHWKLTAKRNEWMVKLFQSNALNTVTIIMDSARRNISEGERYSLEDQIVENTIGLLRFCLTKNMPVELRVTNGAKAHAGNLADFDTAYHMLAELEFEDKTLLNPLAVLTQLLTDAGGNVNIVIFTANITIRLYTQLANAVSKGHYAAVVYFATEKPSPECERIFRLMDEGGFPVFRMRSWGEEE